MNEKGLEWSNEELLSLLLDGKFGSWTSVAIPKTIKVIRNEYGRLIVSMKVGPHLSNSMGNIHGGALATIADALTSLVIALADPKRSSVSIDLHMTYISSAPVGSILEIDSCVTQVGKSMIFSSSTIYRHLPDQQPQKNENNDNDSGQQQNRQIVATALHTKKVISIRSRL